ncbi:uncharacterized protein LOC121383320 [Gigantopelta aegis]|uniref:uncharacterized protein LOC121383320 n=1 Tax=Gigantopelta aegis TaxID=1735272 RepID=UPI001B8896E6|nr:uncharacterized protein LOC121383320 [Gigantopelta aegis]
MTSDSQVLYKSSKDSHKNRCTYSCGNCVVNFYTELSLMLHIANAHPDSLSSLRVVREVTTIFRCRLCDDEFTYLSDFNSHMSVHGPRNKTTIPIIAERIQVTKKKEDTPAPKPTKVKRFSNRQTSSVPIHTRCFSCGKKFTDSSGFTALDSVNFCILPTPECTKCNLAFPTRKELVKHNKIHSDALPVYLKEPDETDQQTAPIKLLKIEENANQQFKLYTCSACNNKFANNISKAKKMLIPCVNTDTPIAFGVPLNGPEPHSQSPVLTESDVSVRQQTYVMHGQFVGSELRAESGQLDGLETKTTECPSVLVGLLQGNRMRVIQPDFMQSSEGRKDGLVPSTGENIMSGTLEDGSEFVIMKSDETEFVVKAGKAKHTAKYLKTSKKKKTDQSVDMSDAADQCMSDVKGRQLPLRPIKPDPDAECIPEQRPETGQNSGESDSNQVPVSPNTAHNVQVPIKTEVTDDDSSESVVFSRACRNKPHRNTVTRSMARKNLHHSNVSTVPVDVKRVEKSVPNHGNRPTIDECLKKEAKSETDLDSLLAVEKPLEGVFNLRMNISTDGERVASDDLDKLLSIEKPFLYDASPEKRQSGKDELVVVKTEPTSPTVDNRSVIGEESENDSRNDIVLPEESLVARENTTGTNAHLSVSQELASSSNSNTVIKSCDSDASCPLKTVKTEPDADSWDHWEDTSVMKTTQCKPDTISDESECLVKIENAEDNTEDISCLPKIKQEKEDLSYEQCASRFPGISPDSDSSNDELQDSRDPNLYSASQVKQEPDDADRLLRIKRDLFCKKGETRKYDDDMSESEASLDSPYLQSNVENMELTSEMETCQNSSVSKPIERIFVPQSMLGVHRLQLNDVLNNVKQKQVASGLDFVDLLNEEAIPAATPGKVSWRKNYRKRIADLMAGKEMTMENNVPSRNKYPNVQSKRRHAHADLVELQMIQKAKQRSTKRSYYGRKIAELTALNKGLQAALNEKNETVDDKKADIKDNVALEVVENVVIDEKTKAQSCQGNKVGKRNTGSLPLKRRNFYEKRIAELRAFEDVDILESETVSVRLSKNTLPENSVDGEKGKNKTDYKERMADLDRKLKVIREKQKLKKVKSKTKESCACPTCGEKFSDQESTVNHMRKVHGNKVVYKCDFCMKMFENKEDKVEHQFVHIEETKSAAYSMLQSDQFKCNICNTSFLFSQSLVQHFRKFHSGDQVNTDS